MRSFVDDLSKELKVTIYPVNRGGSGGLIGVAYVARSKKDGYTILQATQGAVVRAPIFNKDTLNFDPIKDLMPLACFASVPSVFTVTNQS